MFGSVGRSERVWVIRVNDVETSAIYDSLRLRQDRFHQSRRFWKVTVANYLSSRLFFLAMLTVTDIHFHACTDAAAARAVEEKGQEQEKVREEVARMRAMSVLRFVGVHVLAATPLIPLRRRLQRRKEQQAETAEMKKTEAMRMAMMNVLMEYEEQDHFVDAAAGDDDEGDDDEHEDDEEEDEDEEQEQEEEEEEEEEAQETRVRIRARMRTMMMTRIWTRMKRRRNKRRRRRRRRRKRGRRRRRRPRRRRRRRRRQRRRG